jgi:hypothetical protein
MSSSGGGGGGFSLDPRKAMESAQSLIDVARNATSGIEGTVKRELSNAGNSLNRELSNAGNAVNKGLEEGGKAYLKAQSLLLNPVDGANFLKEGFEKAGKNIGNDLKDIMYAVGKGDFNSFGNSLINATSNIMTGGQMNPNLESGRERAEDAAAQAKELSDEDAAIQMSVAETADRTRRVTNILEGSAKQRLKSPGMSLLSYRRK